MKSDSFPKWISTQRGASLLEVLIALVILGIGILGMLALQATSLKTNQLAISRTLAAGLASEITELMRANRIAAESGQYDIALNQTVSSATSIAGNDLMTWKEHLTQLPSGQSSISRNGNIFTITIQWDESRLENGNTQQQFVYRTGL